jgi:hypothetical protein
MNRNKIFKVKEIRWQDVETIEPFQKRIQLWSFVNMAAKTQLSHKVGNVLNMRD